MKNILVFATLFIGITAFAQTETKQFTEKAVSPLSEWSITGVETLNKKLNLTEVQTIKVKELLKRRSEELKSSKSQSSNSITQKINAKYKAEYKKILTPEQLTKYEAEQKEIRLKREPQKVKSTKVKSLKM